MMYTFLTFIKKAKIYEINIISCSCPKNNTGYGILKKKKLLDIGIRKKFVRDIGSEISYLSPPFVTFCHFFHRFVSFLQ